MATKTRRLLRGYWDSTEGQRVLEQIRRREVAPSDVARDLGTSVEAVYNAMSKRRRVAGPIAVNQDFIDRVIRFAEDILGDAVTEHIALQNKKIEEKDKEIDALRAQLQSKEERLKESANALDEFRKRLTTRALREAGVQGGD